MRNTFLPLAVVIIMTAAVLRIVDLTQYPPGPHYDEGAELLIARSIAFGGANLFPIANSYQGRETLYHYVASPLLHVIHDSIFTLQLTSVYMNLLTIAASMALGRAMFSGQRGIWVGLAVGVMMTISFHQVYISRQAFRSVALPMYQALGLLLLWRGLRNGRHSVLWLLVGGCFSALALYTYMASRLFPLWLLIGGLLLLVWDRAHRQRRLGQGVVFFGAFAITALPMLLYALRYPDIFMGRLTEVTNTGTDVTLLESIRLHLRMFFIEGEAYVRYNIPRRPYFTLPEGILMLIGLLGAGWRVLRGDIPAAERAAYALALLSPLMVIPSVISLGGLPPNHMRSLGMVPLIFVLTAVGVDVILSALPGAWQSVRRIFPFAVRQRRLSMLQNTAAGITSVCVLLLIGAALVAQDYRAWAQREDVFYQADGDLAAAADWLPDHADADTRVYVASYHREHPTLITGWRGTITWLGADSFFLPPPGRTGLVIFANGFAPRPTWLNGADAEQLTDIPLGPGGQPVFSAYRVRQAAPPATANSTARNTLLTALGIEASPVAAGTSGQITMRWRVDQQPPYARLRPVLELRDPSGVTLSTSDAFLLSTQHWLPGEVFWQQMTVSIPAATPPGRYPMFVTWVDRDSETYIPYQDDAGGFAGISAQIGQIEVRSSTVQPDALDIPNRTIEHMATGIHLLGWGATPAALRPGESWMAVFYWQASGETPSSPPLMEIALQSVENGAEQILWRGSPLQDRYAVSEWQAGEVLREYLPVRIPREHAAGTVRVVLRGETESTAMTLGNLEVLPVSRTFTSPAPDAALLADFEGRIMLEGYRINGAEDVFSIDLIWRSTQTTDSDYTVFVHVLDASGRMLAQRDRMPLDAQRATYPTSLWLPREIVVDHYRFDELPPGDYDMRVGLYRQADGQRLWLTARDGQALTAPAEYVQFNTHNFGD